MKNSKAKSLLATMESMVYRQRGIYKKIDLVITPSGLYKKKLSKSGMFDCDIIHIPNFLPEGTEFKNVRNGGDYFLYFGRLSIEKGILFLIEAYARAKVKKPLYLVGTGPEEEKIRGFIKEHNLESKIKMLGFKTGDELKQLIQNALCVCLLSAWYENGPYTIMEAQAAGRPVIVSDLGGLPELVTDSKQGIVCERPYLKNTVKALRLVENAPKFDGEFIIEKAKEKFDSTKYVERLVGIYITIIEEKKNG